MATDAERSASYYDAIAGHYDADVTASSRDCLARQAFVELVTRLVPEGRTILDVGCGTGLDCDVYARHGYRVLAYDSSTGMRRELERRCATAIRDGRVRMSNAASLHEALAAWPPPDAVVADFAVLNMVRDLPEFCATVRGHVAPGGWLVVSILNPWHWRELAQPRAWRAVLRRNRGAAHPHLTRHFNSYLHFESEVQAAALGFTLVGRANTGAIVRFDRLRSLESGAGEWDRRVESGFSRIRYWGDADAPIWKRLVWRTPLRRLLGTFVILVLRRDR